MVTWQVPSLALRAWHARALGWLQAEQTEGGAEKAVLRRQAALQAAPLEDIRRVTQLMA